MTEETNNRISWVETDPILKKPQKQHQDHMVASQSRGDLIQDRSSDSFQEKKGCWNTWQEYPKHVLLIVGNEFCERFSYYGMRTVLTLYIINILGFSESNSVAMYHGFIVLCYTTPLLGSILADGYIGKFHTILWISLLYASGNIILAVAATFDKGLRVHPALDILGLVVIAFGTGGIKPCVSAFGGDQFKKGQERLLEAFFSVFYFSINAGSTISSFITPYFRVMSCLDRDTCYPLAFGVPAVLMIVSVIFFVLGSRWYTRYPPKENVMLEVIKVMKSALSNKRFFEVKRSHWLDHHLDNHSCQGDNKCRELSEKYNEKRCFQAQFVEDIKAFLRVSAMYLPVPVFWALFDLQGSRWVLQGVAMDGRLWKGAVLLPDQMPTLNAILIMVFIPIFQGIIYPVTRKIGINPTPLRRMTMGGLLASASFIVAMFVQFGVNKTLPKTPMKNEVDLAFVNTYPCNITINPSSNEITTPFDVARNSSSKLISVKLNENQYKIFNWTVRGNCIGPATVSTAVQAGKAWYTVLSPQGSGTFESELEKSTTGEGQFKIRVQWFARNGPWTSRGTKSGTFLFCSPKDDDYANPCIPMEEDNIAGITVVYNGASHGTGKKHPPFIELKPKYWQLYWFNQTKNWTVDWSSRRTSKQALSPHLVSTNVSFSIPGQGGIYALSITGDYNQSITQNMYTIAPENSVNLLWQIPQYVVITAGEILFSITGLEFSYSQAPQSMKSVIQAVWLLTVAGGDIIDIVVAEARIFTNMAWELLLYSALMAIVILIFAFMAQFWYTYVFYTRDEKDEESAETKH